MRRIVLMLALTLALGIGVEGIGVQSLYARDSIFFLNIFIGNR